MQNSFLTIFQFITILDPILQLHHYLYIAKGCKIELIYIYLFYIYLFSLKKYALSLTINSIRTTPKIFIFYNKNY